MDSPKSAPRATQLTPTTHWTLAKGAIRFLSVVFRVKVKVKYPITDYLAPFFYSFWADMGESESLKEARGCSRLFSDSGIGFCRA